MAKKPAAGNKLFVLDTNVLMHDPSSLFRFEEHDIYLPMVTLEELDNNKKGISEFSHCKSMKTLVLSNTTNSILFKRKTILLNRRGTHCQVSVPR